MTQEDKELLLKDLCARLPYGVKIMVEGWDSDKDCDFTTIETLIGIDDRFIYTIWDKIGNKDKHSIIEPLSILDYKPFLRQISSMTNEEYKEYSKLWNLQDEFPTDADIRFKTDVFDWLNKNHFDYHGLIHKGLAIEVTKENNPYKD